MLSSNSSGDQWPNRPLVVTLIGSALLVMAAIALVTRAARVERVRWSASEQAVLLDPLRGQWVWSREVDRGVVRRQITPHDMMALVGPQGWSGCPEEVLCTHYGIHGLIIGRGDRVHIVQNLVTSSDFQSEGTIRMRSPDLAVIVLDHRFSCAHPGVRSDGHEMRYARVMRREEELWLSVVDFADKDPSLASDIPPLRPENWVVYRRVTREAFYQRYLIRLCQPTADAPACDPQCFSDLLGN